MIIAAAQVAPRQALPQPRGVHQEVQDWQTDRFQQV
jgi:hypothetical protein